MRGTLMYAAGGVRVEDVPDPSIADPTDAIVRVTSACLCGSDLWPYADLERTETGWPMGHEAIGVVEDVGAEVRTIKPGDLVVTVDLDGVPDGYRAMADRESIKVLVTP